MLTLSSTENIAGRRAIRIATATALAATVLSLMGASAYAEGREIDSCIGGRFFFNCVSRWGDAGDPYVRTVPQAADDTERAHAAERERRWEARCRPTIVQDRFGVPRYQYAAPGCEFGVLE